MAPRILIFLIAMVADYSFDVKNIDIWAPAFFKHNDSFIATVYSKAMRCTVFGNEKTPAAQNRAS